MPYTTQEAIYTDVNPLDASAKGRVLKEGDPDARYVLAGVGGVVSDEVAARYGLNKPGNELDVQAARDELAKANEATYGQGGVSFAPEAPRAGAVVQSPQDGERAAARDSTRTRR